MGTADFGSVPTALAELARCVAEAQAGNPLAPVTVVVPSHAAGLDVTRYLGRTLNAGRGSAAVSAFTLTDLASELVAAAGAARGRASLPPILREGAIRTILAKHPGLFAAVADQPATSRAIAATSMLLDAVPTSKHADLPALAREVARIHDAAASSLTTNWYTEHETYLIAAGSLDSPAVLRRLGTVIGLMPTAGPGPSAGHFRQQLEDRAGMVNLQATAGMGEQIAVFSASDADDECRAVVRMVLERLAAGTPGHRIGVFYSAAQPYLGLMSQRLAEAGVTVVGPNAFRLADTPIARGLLRLLDIVPEDPDVRSILMILAEGTLQWSEQQLPSSAACERLHTTPPDHDDADNDGVSANADDDGVSTDGNDAAGGDIEVSSAKDTEAERLRAEHHIFQDFQGALAGQIRNTLDAGSWDTVAAELESLIGAFMGPRSEAERPELAAAREKVLAVARNLRILDGVAPPPTPRAIRAAVERGIEAGTGWAGKSGTGVVLGSYADGVGRDLDSAFLVGAAEGLAPARIREDPLLPDDVRRRLGAGLPTVEDRAAATRSEFFAALATGAEHVLTFPRGDLRGGGSYQPSRWITASLPESWVASTLPSYTHGITTGAPTATSLASTGQEWRLRRRLASDPGPGGGRAGNDPVDDDVLALALQVRRDRRRGIFSRFNGNVGAYAGRIMDPDRPLSPTSLEDWVISPLAYFLKRVLRVEILEDAELEVQIGKLQRGNLMHQVLEDYVGEITAAGRPPSSARLLELAEAAYAAQQNPAWLAQVWDRDKAVMRQDFVRIFDADAEAAAAGWDHIAAEMAFGLDPDAAPVELELADGSTVRFAGKVDRVDRHAGGTIKVIDYKTGKADKYKDLSGKNPTAGGTRFQLPVYGLFARHLRDDATAEISAEYWFITGAGGHKRQHYTITDEVFDRLRSDIGLVVSALRNGVFPPKPEPDHYTGFISMMGAAGVRHTWEALQDCEELAAYAALLKREI